MNKRFFRRAISLILMSAMVLSMAACGGKQSSGGGQGGTGSQESQDKPKPTTMTMAINGEAGGLDPNMQFDTVSSVWQQGMFEGLLREKNGDSLTIEPWLAESYEISEDGLEITFKIRQGVKFHNGETMTTEDVAFSYNRAIAATGTSALTNTMDHMEAVDDTTCVLHLKQPYLPVLKCLTMCTMSIVSKKAVEECEKNGTDFARNPVGTGKYKFVSWASGDRATYERFEDYWGEPAACETFVLRYISDSTTGGLALENGEIDVLYGPNRADAKHMMNDLENITFDSIAGAGYTFMFFNCVGDSPFADIRVRKAAAMALNRSDLMVAGVEGIGTLIECPLAPTIDGYDHDQTWYEYNVDEAKKLMAEAGYPNGFTIHAEICQQAQYKACAEAAQAQLRTIGIDMQIDLVVKATFISDVWQGGNCDVSIYLANCAVQDADFELYRRYHSGVQGQAGNLSGLSSPEVDAWLEEARSSTDAATRSELYVKVIQWAKDNAICVPFYTANMNVAYNNAVGGVHAHPVNKFNIADFYWK